MMIQMINPIDVTSGLPGEGAMESAYHHGKPRDQIVYVINT